MKLETSQVTCKILWIINFYVISSFLNIIFLYRNFLQPKCITLYDFFSPPSSSLPERFWNIREFGAKIFDRPLNSKDNSVRSCHKGTFFWSILFLNKLRQTRLHLICTRILELVYGWFKYIVSWLAVTFRKIVVLEIYMMNVKLSISKENDYKSKSYEITICSA